MTPDPDAAALAREYRLGARVFLAFGIGFAVWYAFAAPNVWRFLLFSICLVCLVRAVWYMLQAKRLSRDAGPPDPPPAKP